MNTPRDVIQEIEDMRAGVSYSHIISIRKFQLKVRPISNHEQLQVASEVQKKMAVLTMDMRNQLTEHQIVARETLKFASTSDVGKTDWGITDIIMDKMTPDEIQFLFQQYVQVTDRTNPKLEKMTNEQLEELVVALKKTPADRLDLELIEVDFWQTLNLLSY